MLFVLLMPCSLVVTPLCAKLSSQDPAVAAAARSEAVAAALAASKSGLPEQLHAVIAFLQTKLSGLIAEGLEPAEALCRSPAQAVRHVTSVMVFDGGG